MKRDHKLLAFGAIGGFIASLCCIGPVIIVLFGLGSLSFALSIGTYSWLFISLGIIFFVTALIFYLNKKKSCNIRGVKKHWKQIIVAFVIMALVLIIIKYWLATYLAQIAYR